MDNDKGWHRLFESMFSGAPGSLTPWAILGYGVWASLHGRWDSGDTGSWGGDGDGDGGD